MFACRASVWSTTIPRIVTAIRKVRRLNQSDLEQRSNADLQQGWDQNNYKSTITNRGNSDLRFWFRESHGAMKMVLKYPRLCQGYLYRQSIQP